MKYKIFQIIYIIFMLCTFVSSCYITEDSVFVCTSPTEIALEGNSTWISFYLVNTLQQKYVLKPNAFKRTPNLETITLSSLTDIQPGALKGLMKLEKLVFYQTNITEMPLGVIDELPITHLQIFENSVEEFAPGFFSNLPELGIADLRQNKIKIVKAGVFNNTSILKLYLNNNQIVSIEPNAFAEMIQLSYLGLSGNQLKEFNSNELLGTSPSLTQLWLNRNIFTKITKDMFATLPNLQNLYLEINQIVDIEDRSFNLPFLDFLDLSNNLLTEIRPQVLPKKGLPHLRLILLQNNKLTFINAAMFIKLPKLGYMSYGGNPYQCACLNEIQDWVFRKNISRICDKEYDAGERPTCVVHEEYPKICIYDTDLSENLYDEFNVKVKEYPNLQLKCDTTHGVQNSKLGYVE